MEHVSRTSRVYGFDGKGGQAALGPPFGPDQTLGAQCDHDAGMAGSKDFHRSLGCGGIGDLMGKGF
jgi:hypothetical protein